MNHQLVDEALVVDLPRLPVPAAVAVWRVPAEYRANGLFIAVNAAGEAPEVPACDHGAPAFSAELPADEAAVESAVAYRARAAAKVARAELVDRISVTTAAGNTFDGDETSQTRMARAIIALQATGTPITTWVLANNAPIEVSAAELVEALALAGAAQAAAWVIA